MKKAESLYCGKKDFKELEIPNLLVAQLNSYHEFLQISSAEKGTDRLVRMDQGLEGVFRKNFPIVSNNGTLSLEYVYYLLEPAAHSIAECKLAGLTYGSALRICLRIIRRSKEGELIQARETKHGHEVFLGIIPLMTERGTFIINGVERVIISRLQRSPGVYFKEENSSPREYSARIVSKRGMWLEFRSDGGNILYAHLGKKKVSVSTFFSALGYNNKTELTNLFFPKGTANGEGYELWKNTLERKPLVGQEEALLEIYSLFRPGDPISKKKAGDFFTHLFFFPETYGLSEAGRSQLNKKLKRSSQELVLEKEDVIGTLSYLFGLYQNQDFASSESGDLDAKQVETKSKTDSEQMIYSVDDIDHLGNKRVRMVGELVAEQVEIGLSRLARLVQDRLNFSKTEEVTPQELVNSRNFSSAIKDFFARSPYSQLVDQTNPLAELTHKRRLTAIGEGVFSERKRIGFEVRDVHYTHYGRICPIETPEGGNIGILTSLATYARVDKLGFLRSPYRVVKNGVVMDEIKYLSADEEDNYHIAPASTQLDKTGKIIEKEVLVRYRGIFPKFPVEKVDFIDVSARQVVSVSTSLVPFLEHDDANRALMGSNMQRQALPLLRPSSPLVKTGIESVVVRDSGVIVKAEEDGVVTYVDGSKIVISAEKNKPGDLETEKTYNLLKFQHLNQDTVFNQRPLVQVGQKIKKGDLISDGPAVDASGQLALGQNVLVAFLPWRGYNFEDAIVLSERLVKDDTFTSIHIKEFEAEARETELGVEEITRDIPNVGEETLANLDEEGIIRVGAHIKPNDILVGKVTPRSETELTPEERLLRVIFGEKAREVDNTSLYAPPGISGIVVDVRKFERVSDKEKSTEEESRRQEEISGVEKRRKDLTDQLLKQAARRVKEILPQQKIKEKPSLSVLLSLKTPNLEKQKALNSLCGTLEKRLEEIKKEAKREIQHIKQGDELGTDVVRKVVVQVAIKKPVSVGDKMSGRHGNKGVIARIVPQEDLPFLPDGTPVDVVLNPLGVPSRMNVGQILETHLGWAAKSLGFSVQTPIFNSASEEQISGLLLKAGLPADGKIQLYDGVTGNPFDVKTTCGYIYMMKLYHLADDKIHARSVGSYSLVTQQPLGGRAQFGGQRFGEMEVWALEGYGASNILQEILTVKSDDIQGRKKVYENIVKDRDFDYYQSPESFNVLMSELKGLGFDIKLVKKTGEKEAVSISLASPEVVKSSSHGEIKKPETINYRTFKAEKDGLFCEKIFGPVKDWECACGKYKKVKYRGIVCDRCGVEVTTSDVRRTRAGHIPLAACVSYVWIFKSLSNWMGTLLDMSQNHLELVLYFERYLVLDPADSPHRVKDLITEKEYRETLVKFPKLKAEIGALAIKELLQNINLEKEKDVLQKELSKVRSSQGQRRAIIKKLKIVDGLLRTNTKPEWMITDVIPVIPPDLRPLLPLEGGRFATSDLNDLYQRIINRNNRLKRLLKLHAPDIIIRNEKRMLQEAVDALFDNGRHGPQVLGRNSRPLKSLADTLRGKQGRFRQNLLGKRVDYSGRAVVVVGPDLKLSECGLPKHMALELFAPFILRELRRREYVHTISSAKRALERNDPEVWEILEDVTRNHPILLNRQPTLHRLSIQAFYPRLIEENVIKLHPLVCTAFNADFDGDQMAVHVPLSVEAQMEAQLILNASTHVFSPSSGKPIINLSREALLGCYYLTLKNNTLSPDGGKFAVYAGVDEVLRKLDAEYLSYHQPVRVRMNGAIVETTPGRILFNELLPGGMEYHDNLVDGKILGRMIKEIYNRFGYEKTAQFLDRAKDVGFQIATRSGLTIGIRDLAVPKDKKELVETTAKEVHRIESDYRKGIITEGERYHKVVDTWTSCTSRLSEHLFASLKNDLENKFLINPIYLMVQSGARGNKQQVTQLMAMRGLMTRPTKKITGGIGEIIESPVIANFREGLTVMEYFISTHGGRKGLVDTALKTSNAGYLSRRLVDVSQDMVISIDDCQTNSGVMVTPVWDGERLMVPLGDRIIGRVAVDRIVDIVNDEVIVESNELITEKIAARIEEMGIEKFRIRSVLTCKAPRGLCQKCYGWNLTTGKMVEIGEAVGIVAAQSIGEPGTQLTLRTFHIGGTASRIVGETEVKVRQQKDIKQKKEAVNYTVKFQGLFSAVNRLGQTVVLNRGAKLALIDERGREVEHYLAQVGDILQVKDGDIVHSKTRDKEATSLLKRDPYMLPIVAQKSGVASYEGLKLGVTFKEELDEVSKHSHKVIISHKEDIAPVVVVRDSAGNKIDSHYLPVDTHPMVEDGQKVLAGDNLARIPRRLTGRVQDITGGLPRIAELFEARRPKNPAILSEIDGKISTEINEKNQRVVKISSVVSDLVKSYLIPFDKHLLVSDGSYVQVGEKLTEGAVDLDDLLRIGGEHKVHEYLLNEIQSVYRLEGVALNDKHIEIVIRQMLSRVRIEKPGDTLFLEGEAISRVRATRENERIEADGGQQATLQPLVMGITRVALASESFISAASFQETLRVLTDAALMGVDDPLLGIKENVILGRLIPAGTGFFLRTVRENRMKDKELESLNGESGDKKHSVAKKKEPKNPLDIETDTKKHSDSKKKGKINPLDA
ncbi:MAG: DNA-directed RNA polymerase subunit beta' [Candidatus Ratteibacteria bacterium]|jgi:DNA-directed RNA polymerase subunit beta-beta'